MLGVQLPQEESIEGGQIAMHRLQCTTQCGQDPRVSGRSMVWLIDG